MSEEEYSPKDNKKVDIFGSCVTRDIFSFMNNDKIKLGEYIARQSVVTVYTNPIHCDKKEISGISSDFQKRILRNDFEKTTFNKFRLSKGDYIVVDFIDERYRIVKVNHTYLTYSNELAISGYLSDKKYKILDKKIGSIKILYLSCKKIESFAKELEDIYGSGKIIIHKAMMKDEYLDKDRNIQLFQKPYLEDNKRKNALLEYMYGELACKLSDPHIIDTGDLYYADEANKWGLSTMHYQKEYYMHVSREIEKIVLNTF